MARRKTAGGNHEGESRGPFLTKLFLGPARQITIRYVLLGDGILGEEGVVQSLDIFAMLRVGFVFCVADAGPLRIC